MTIDFDRFQKSLLDSFCKREALWKVHDAVRVYDESALPLVIEKFKDYAFLTWRGEVLTQFEEQRLAHNLKTVWSKVFDAPIQAASLLHRPKANLAFKESDTRWILGGVSAERSLWVKEWGLPYQIRFMGHAHPGLFLDHRELRRLLSEENADGGRVLNLFAFTGSLGLAGLHGGYESLDQVDISKPNLEWIRENFREHTKVHSCEKRMQVFAGDAEFFIQRSIKREEKYDAIFCDPPSFARKKTGEVFSVLKSYPTLIENCLRLLNQEGLFMFSANLEGITHALIEGEVNKFARILGLGRPTFKRLSGDKDEFESSKGGMCGVIAKFR